MANRDSDRFVEATKLEFDHNKHITTLSVGSILIIAAFLRDVFPDPVGKGFIVTAIIMFIIAIFGAVLSNETTLVTFLSKKEKEIRRYGSLGVVFSFITGAAFGAGIFSVAGFVIINFLDL